MKNPGSPDVPPAPDLRTLQRVFGRAIMQPLDASQGRRRSSAGDDSSSIPGEALVKPNDRLDSFERLEIYNRQYWFRLINSFYEDFPALRAVLGEERFYDLTIAYLEANPSRSFTLRDLGNRLESFLAAEPRWVAPHERLARDIVRLEWAHIVAFDGAEMPPLDVDELLDANPAELRIGFQPHLTFLECDYAVDDFVLATRKQEFNPAELSNAVSEQLRRAPASPRRLPLAEKNWLAVYRLNNAVYYKRLDCVAYEICTTLQRGEPLQAACEKAVRNPVKNDDLFAQLQLWFANWASLGWLVPAGSS